MTTDEDQRRPGEEDDAEPITTVDGAVRQLEKADVAAENRERAGPAGGDERRTDVQPLGKAGNGAPEETVARDPLAP